MHSFEHGVEIARLERVEILADDRERIQAGGNSSGWPNAQL
jgi:hypothetical protein